MKTISAMASDLHDKQSALGAKWLKRNGFAVVGTEIVAAGCREQADAIGFRMSCSVVIESKVSRADFLADRKKPERNKGGLGVYRFYICPPGVIREDDLPDKWGLLYADAGKVVEIVRPRGNVWPPFSTRMEGWDKFKHEPNLEAERQVLFSLCRRLAQGEPILR
jgi:hypothetical protein